MTDICLTMECRRIKSDTQKMINNPSKLKKLEEGALESVPQ